MRTLFLKPVLPLLAILSCPITTGADEATQSPKKTDPIEIF